MKRALLTGFDPLPAALSTKGLSALVAVVVLGTGFTVQRYVESSQAAAHHGNSARFDRPSEVRASPSEGAPAGYVKSRRSSDSHERGCGGWRAAGAVPCPSVEAASTQAKTPTTPSIFQPGDASVGG